MNCFVWISVTYKSSPSCECSQKTYVNLTSFQLDDNILNDLSSVLSRQTSQQWKKPQWTEKKNPLSPNHP